MPPGPPKQFDPDRALEKARDLFWRRGYDGTGVADLEAELGIGRKSLYDTFGNKRALYLRALEHYGSTVIAAICAGLERPDSDALANLERVLDKLARHHGSRESLGCLLGVGMAQAARDDAELIAVLRAWLARLESAFEAVLHRALAAGAVRADVHPRDVAAQLVALTQGLALMGRISSSSSAARAAVRAALDGLRP
ncbi:MAG: TetR/AcrR family transcriptional regulator [Planctomycetes bacterium]|nr:TetR/AcrR family transcriptional regulator [Planctomycetota bacterium]